MSLPELLSLPALVRRLHVDLVRIGVSGCPRLV